MAVNIRVDDYSTWREGFDAGEENRANHSSRPATSAWGIVRKRPGSTGQTC
jgi:hypothetical protein